MAKYNKTISNTLYLLGENIIWRLSSRHRNKTNSKIRVKEKSIPHNNIRTSCKNSFGHWVLVSQQIKEDTAEQTK